MSETRKKWTLAINRSQDDRPRKITKIIGLNGGGFSVLAPYHKARSGVLIKMPVDPEKALTPGAWFVPHDEVVPFDVTDRAKFSYHTDGFVQFSSESPGRIISGRDPATGEPKGLGLMSHPLTNPIWTGPSASVTAWGLDDFDVADESKAMIVFGPKDFYFRECIPNEATAWKIDIFAFPINVVPPVRFDDGAAILDVALERLNGALASVIRMKLLHLPEEKVFLGIYINAFVGHFPPPSGWVLGGAGNWGAGRIGHVLKGIYPRDMLPPARGSLDRTPKSESS